MAVTTESFCAEVNFLKRMLKDTTENHADRLGLLRSLAFQVKNEELSLTELVDIGFLLREIEDLLDEMRKDVKAHKEMIGKVACYQLALEDKTSYKGTLAIGTVKIDYYSSIPHPDRDPVGFKNVCKWFGIDIGTSPNGSVRLHWPAMKKHITKCIEEGGELPPELSDVKSDLGMTYRRLANKD